MSIKIVYIKSNILTNSATFHLASDEDDGGRRNKQHAGSDD